jgi:hypothetical protein
MDIVDIRNGCSVPGPADSHDTSIEHDIIYLACPYTHPDAAIRRWRFDMATAAAATLIRRGLVVFSPITMTHPLDVVLAGDNSLGSEFWIKFDEAFMRQCSQMVVLQIAGWDHSSGVKREIEYFRACSKPISFMIPADVENAPSLPMKRRLVRVK